MERKTFFESMEAMQKDLDAYLLPYDTERLHQERGTVGTTLDAQRMPRQGRQRKR